MKKTRLNSSILAATSLAAVSQAHGDAQELGNNYSGNQRLTLTAGQLGDLNSPNDLTVNTDVKFLDLTAVTADFVSDFKSATFDFATIYPNLRGIKGNQFLDELNIKLNPSFFTAEDDSLSFIKVVLVGEAATDKELNVDLSKMLPVPTVDGEPIIGADGKQFFGDVIVDVKDSGATSVNTGAAASRVELSGDDIALTARSGTFVKQGTKTVTNEEGEAVTTKGPISYKALHVPGLELTEVILNPLGSINLGSADLSDVDANGKTIRVDGFEGITEVTFAEGTNLSGFVVDGKRDVDTNATMNRLQVTDPDADESAITHLSDKAKTVVAGELPDLKYYTALTALDFSKFEGATTAEAAASALRIHTILTSKKDLDEDNNDLITYAEEMTISSKVLDELMRIMDVSDLTSFTALKKLHIKGSGAYETNALTKAQMPPTLVEYYSKDLVIRKGQLSEALALDSKFSATVLDLEDLDLNGQAITVGGLNASKVTTLKLNPALCAVADSSNFIAAGSNKTITVKGDAGGALTTANLANVGTIDLSELTGATGFSAELNKGVGSSNLTSLKLPASFDVTQAALLNANANVNVVFSGAYAGAQVLEGGYNGASLDFSAVTGTGLFEIGAATQSLKLGNGVSGVNVGGAAAANQFDLSELTNLAEISGVPITATDFRIDNSGVSDAIILDLSTLTNLLTLSLGGSKISELSLPTAPNLTNGLPAKHLNLGNVQNLKVLNGLDALLDAGHDVVTPGNSQIVEVSLPLNPDPDFKLSLVATRPGVTFNNLDQVHELTLDADYAPTSRNMWPTVQNKTQAESWIKFFNYIMASIGDGGLGSPNIFDLSGQAITSQAEADQMVSALNSLTNAQQGAMQKLIIRISTAAAIDLSDIDFAPATNVIIDRTAGSTGAITTPPTWAGKVVEYARLADAKAQGTWDQYLNYRLASLADKGLGLTDLDIRDESLSAAEWADLMVDLDGFANAGSITSMHLKLAPGVYGAAPAFTTATLTSATSIIVDVTGVNDGTNQINVTGLPAANPGLIVEQRVTDAAQVDKTSAASWQGYIEHSLLSATSLNLQDANLHIEDVAQLTALSTALEALSAANKAIITDIALKIAIGDRGTDFALNTNLAGFTNLNKVTVDATDSLNGSAQVDVGFGMGFPANSYAYVSKISSVHLDSQISWGYYFNHLAATANIASLDLTAAELSAQADLTAALLALHARTGDKDTIQSLQFRLSNTYSDPNFDLGADIGAGAEASGFSHANFAVEVQRNGANSGGNPVSITFGNTVAADTIRSSNTTIVDNAFNTLGSFTGTSHQWLGYTRMLLSSVATGETKVLDFTIHANLELSNASVAAFIAGMNALPTEEKAKVSGLKLKLATGDFGGASLDLTSLSEFVNFANLYVERNGALENGNLNSAPIDVVTFGTTSVTDPEAFTVAALGQTNSWLSHLTFLLGNMTGIANTLDLSSFVIASAAHATAFNNAMQALPSSAKAKIQKIKLATSATVELGTTVSDLDNLTHVIIDNTAAPNAAVSFAAGSSFDAPTNQKLYVTDAIVARTNNAWGEYIDYVMSPVADGGLGLTDVNLQAVELDSAQAGQLFTAISAYSSEPNSVTITLASAFGAAALDIDVATANITVYRNGAVHGAPAAPVAVSLINGGTLSIVDPTANNIADTAVAQNWLAYITYILDDAGAGATLNLSSIAIDDADAVIAFNAALVALPSALAEKVDVLKVNVTYAADIALGAGSNLANLSRVEYTKPFTNTVTFAGSLANQRTYLTDLADVRMDVAGDWAQYLNYMLSTDNGGQSATSLDVSSRVFNSQAALDFFFADLDSLDGLSYYANKNVLETLRIELANGLNGMVIGRVDNTPTAASSLNSGIRVIVNPTTSIATTHAGSQPGEVQADNLIVLDSTAALNRNHIAHLVEQGGFNGTLDLSALALNNQAAASALVVDLNNLSADMKDKVSAINLTLIAGDFGSADVTLDALVGFTGVTFNVNRNGARNGAGSDSALVTVTNNSGHTLNVTDNEFQDMSTFDNESSAHWLGYLVHELDNAPADYVLDLTVHSALMLDSAAALAAFNEALKLAPNKGNVETLKVKSSLNGGEIGTLVSGYTSLANVVVDYTSGALADMTSAFVGVAETVRLYISDASVINTSVADWTRYFNYQLNAAAIGGLEKTALTIPGKLNATQVTSMVSGLDAATSKAAVETIVFDIDSTVSGNLTLDASGLDALQSATINTNGSAAKIIPLNSFVGTTLFNSLNNVKIDTTASWQAYFEGSSDISDLDVREVELAAQAELIGFLSGLDAASNKATVTAIKLKLATAYAGPADFSESSVTGLNLGANNSVEVHRNGSAAAVLEDAGGEITDARIKVVDLSADSLTDRADSEAWRRYITSVVEDGGFAGPLNLAADSDTYVRTNAHLTALFTGLQQLSAENKALITEIAIKCAAGTTWSNVANLGSGLTDFSALTKTTIDVTGALSNGGADQMTVAFNGAAGAQSVAIVTDLSAVDKNDANSWTYYFNSAAMTDVDVSSITLDNTEAGVFLGALGSGITAKNALDSVTFKLTPAFGAASLNINTTGFKPETVVDADDGTVFTVDRNGAAHASVPVAITIGAEVAGTTLSVIDPQAPDISSVVETNSNAWLHYLTSVLTDAGAVTNFTLDLTNANLVLSTVAEATALSEALDALAPALKAKIETIQLKAEADLTVSANFSDGFTNIAAIELEKPAANILTVSQPGAAELRIASLGNVNRTNADDWMAHINALLAGGDVDLMFTDGDLGKLNLNNAELTAFMGGMNAATAKASITAVDINVASGAWDGGAHITGLGAGFVGFTSLAHFLVNVSDATHGGAQLQVGFNGSLPQGIAIIDTSDLSHVDRDSAASWEYLLNGYTWQNFNAPLVVMDAPLSLAELGSLETGLTNFNTNSAAHAVTFGELTDILVHVSGAAGAGSVNFAPTLTNQSGFTYPIIVDISGFTHNGTQAVVADGVTPTNIELRLSDASQLVRDSQASWNAHLNYLKSENAGTMPATLDLSGDADLYLRSQADVDALMLAIENHADKATITTINVQLAPGNFGSDLLFGTGTTGWNPTATITATGAHNNGTPIIASDVTYVGGVTDTNKTVIQDFAVSISDKENVGQWTSLLQYMISPFALGGEELSSLKLTGAYSIDSGAQLAAVQEAIEALSADLKTRIRNITLDLTSIAGAIELGEYNNGGVVQISGLDNLENVYYLRTTAADDATVAGGSSFDGHLQRLRSVWDANAANAEADMTEFLLHELLDSSVGGSENGVLDLSSITLDNADAGTLNSAIDALPADLKVKLTSLHLSLNTAVGAITLDASGLSNFATVRVDYSGANTLTLANSFSAATDTLYFTAIPAADDATQWARYVAYQIDALSATTFDVTSVPSTSAALGAFLTALNAHAGANTVTGVDLTLATNFGAASFDLSTYANLTAIAVNEFVVNRNGASSDGASDPVTFVFGAPLTDTKVRIVDLETNTTASNANSIQEWLEYFTNQINTVGLNGGLLTIAPANPNEFATQAEIYTAFDALELLDSGLKELVVHIDIDLSNMDDADGAIRVDRTGDLALTGFTNLAAISYNRSNVAQATATALPTIKRYRTQEADVTKDNATHWEEFLNHELSAASKGGSGLTTLTIAHEFATQAEVTAFIAGLNALDGTNGKANKATLATLNVAFAAAYASSIDLSAATGLVGLTTLAIDRQNVTGFAPVVYGNIPQNVVQIDDATVVAADSTDTNVVWLRYFANTVPEIAPDGIILNIAPVTPFNAQAQVYTMFDALGALSPHLKANVEYITINISGIAAGNVSLAQTADAALTGFTNLKAVYYDRAGIDFNASDLRRDFNTALDAALDGVATLKTWPFADTAAINTAVDEAIGTDIVAGITPEGAISQRDVTSIRGNLAFVHNIIFPQASDVDDAVDAAVTAALASIPSEDFVQPGARLIADQNAIKESLYGGNLGANADGTLNTRLQALSDGSTASWLLTSWNGGANTIGSKLVALIDSDPNGTLANIASDGNAITGALQPAVKDDFLNFGGADAASALDGNAPAGSLGQIVYDLDLTVITDYANRAVGSVQRNNFRAALSTALEAALVAAFPWIDAPTIDTLVVGTIYAEGATLDVGSDGVSATDAAIKTDIWERLTGSDQDPAHVIVGFSAMKTQLDAAIDTAFTDAAYTTALTNHAAAWVRNTAAVTAAIEAHLDAKVQGISFSGAAGATGTANEINTDEVNNLAFPALGTDTPSSLQWREWIDAYIASATVPTTIDLRDVEFTSQAQLDMFFEAMSFAIQDNPAGAQNVTRIDLNLTGYGANPAILGRDLGENSVTVFNDALDITVINPDGATVTGAAGATGTANEINTDEIVDLTLPALGTGAGAATAWRTWIQSYTTNIGAYIDLRSVSFTSQGQLDAFFDGLGQSASNVEGGQLVTRIDLDLSGYTDGGNTAIMGADVSTALVNGLNNINVNVVNTPTGITLSGAAGPGATAGAINNEEVFDLSALAAGTDAGAVTAWTTWVQDTITASGGATIDLRSVSFTSQAQLNALFEGIGASTEAGNITLIELDLSNYTDAGNAAVMGRNVAGASVTGLNAGLTVSLFNKEGGFVWYGSANATAAGTLVDNALAFTDGNSNGAADVVYQLANGNEAAIQTALKAYFTANVTLPTAASLFDTPITTALDAPAVQSVIFTVSSNVTGTNVGDIETPTRFRTDLVDVAVDVLDSWMDYLRYQLTPTDEGGLGATVIDVSSQILTYGAGGEAVGQFVGAINSLPPELSTRIEEIRVEVSGYTTNALADFASLDNTDARLANLARTIVYTDEGHMASVSNATVGNTYAYVKSVTTQPSGGTHADRSRVWTRYLQYQLAHVDIGGLNNDAGGVDNVNDVNIDIAGLGAGLDFASQLELNAFFNGLDGVIYENPDAKQDLANLTIALVDGEFTDEADSGIAYIGRTDETGALGTIGGLKDDMVITVNRKGATYGSNGVWDPMVAIQFVGTTLDASNLSDDAVIVDASAGSVTNRESTADWLEYLTQTLVAAGAVTNFDLDLTGAPFQLGTANEGTALSNALQALPQSLKDKIGNIQLHATVDGVTVGTGVTGLNNLAWVSIAKTTRTDILTVDGDLASAKVYIPNLTHVSQSVALDWAYYGNHRLSSGSVGGAGSTSIDVSSEALTSLELTAFLDGLDLLNGAGSMANRSSATSIIVDLVTGDFGAASIDLSIRSGYGGLGANGFTINRNGAVDNGTTNPVTITYGTVGGELTDSVVRIVDPRNADTANVAAARNSSQAWLEYLTDVLDGAGSQHTLDLSPADLQLNGTEAGTITEQGDALITALLALDSSLKAKIDTINIKLAAVNHGADLTFSAATLNATTGFQADLKIFVDVAGATSDGSTQIVANVSSLTVSGTVEAHVSDIATVVLDSATSWEYFLNWWVSSENPGGSITSIDTNGAIFTGDPQSAAFFGAIEARVDKASIEDIFMHSNTGALTIGLGSSGLTALRSVVVRDQNGAAVFSSAGDVAASDLAVINPATGTLGTDPTTVADWKGYLAHLLEDTAHGGATDATSIAIDLSTVDGINTHVATLAVLQNLETALNELPSRLQSKINAVLIKTLNNAVDLSDAYEFGDTIGTGNYSSFGTVTFVIDSTATTTPGNKPVFDATFSGRSNITTILF